MADHELNLCPIWDITQSHTLAFLKYEPAMVDFSITLGGGQLGVAFALFDPAAFTARFGTPPQPLLHPGDAHGNPFCWSHGPCQHTGLDCTKPDPGHKENATWQSQMGSKWKAYFQGRGWSAISP